MNTPSPEVPLANRCSIPVEGGDGTLAVETVAQIDNYAIRIPKPHRRDWMKGHAGYSRNPAAAANTISKFLTRCR